MLAYFIRSLSVLHKLSVPAEFLQGELQPISRFSILHCLVCFKMPAYCP